MHHYSSHTESFFLARDQEIERIWKQEIPLLAMDNPHLMHGLLSLSALHLAYLRPMEQRIWIQFALKHQNTALKLFRAALSSLNENNFHSSLALSVLLSVSSMTFSNSRKIFDQNESSQIEDVIEPLIHINAVYSMLQTGRRWLKSSPMAAFTRVTLPSPRTKLCPSAETQFNELQTLIDKSCSDKSTRKRLTETLRNLHIVFCNLVSASKTKQPHLEVVWRWPAFVSQEYVLLLRTADPIALIIFAHFAILSAVFDQQWYLSGYPRRALHAIRVALPKPWQKFLDWPEAQLNEQLCELFDGDVVRHASEVNMKSL
jgi:Fungal specific transcription factor domain